MGWETKWPHFAAATRYAEAVERGKIPACLHARRACLRQLEDLARDDWRFAYDPVAGEEICRYIERLPHVKGDWAKRGELIRLEPWQQFNYTTLFGWVYGEDVHADDGSTIARAGDRRFRTAFTMVPRKNSKALALDTLVATPMGFSTIANLGPGDVVLGPDGGPKRVLGESPVFINRRCYEVEFSTGERFVCDGEHLWTTTARVDSPGRRSRRGDKPGSSRMTRPRTTLELLNTVTYGKRGDRNHAIAVACSLKLPAADLCIDPYVLGAWLGDGHSAEGRITNIDREVLEELNRIEGGLIRVGASISYRLGPNYRDDGVTAEETLRGRLRSLGVLGDKHIPVVYLRSSEEQRRELMRGLMDTDGTVSKAGQCIFSGTNERLIDDVYELAATLGLKPTKRFAEARLYEKPCGTAWSVAFWPTFPVFKIERKRQRQTDRAKRQRSRTICSIREVPSEPTKCLSVEGGEFLIGRGLIATHNSTMAAGVGLYMLREDEEYGSEVYSSATTRNQAKIVFNLARQMALRAHLGVEVRVHNLSVTETASLFEPLHAQGETLDGHNIHCAINDEVHAWKKRAVYDVIETATGARRQPMIYNITTAGDNLEGICYELYGYLTRILSGAIEDDSFFGIVYGIDQEDMEHWLEPEVWRKANPNWGVSVLPMDVQALAKKAIEIPSQQNAFLTKRLDVWVNAAVAWMDMVKWQRCYDASMRIEDFRGENAWLGTDLASKIDVNSQARLFRRYVDGQEHLFCFMRHWLPEAAIQEDRFGQYDGWVRMGAIEKTPGNVVDVDAIEADTLEFSRAHRVVELGVDPGHNSTQYGVHMAKEGLEVVDVRPTVLNFSEPMKWLEAYVKDGRFHHNCPVLTWMVSNVVARRDQKDNIYPRKDAPSRKIDGAIAVMIALNRLKAGDDSTYWPSDGIQVI